MLRRDRYILLAALAAIILLAWAWLAWLGSAGLSGQAGSAPDAMAGMRMEPPAGPLAAEFSPWSAGEFLLMLAMWTAMMVGMMTPSAAPMLLLYARVARQADERGHAFAATGWFAGGYLLAWSAFALIATVLQWMLESAALLNPAMALASRPLAATFLIATGIYQWTPLKQACLGRCRSPLQFIQDNGGFRPGRGASVVLGLKHGAYCIGCCWALMLLLFVGGVMSLLWIAALAALVLGEKIIPGGAILARVAGAAMLVAGVGLASGLL